MKCEDCKKKVLTHEYYSYRLRKTLNLCEACRWHRSQEDRYLYSDPDDCWNIDTKDIRIKPMNTKQRWESTYNADKIVSLDYNEKNGRYTLTIHNLTPQEIYDLDTTLAEAFADIHNPIIESIFDVVQKTIGDPL